MREIMLILHFVGLTMGLGTGFAHAFLGMATAKMSPEEVVKFRVHSLVLGRMGNIGIGLLIVSGLYLITPYWNVAASMPLLMVKLGLVMLLAGLITMINSLTKKAIQGNAAEHLKKMEKLGKLTLPLGLIIIVLAVYIFH